MRKPPSPQAGDGGFDAERSTNRRSILACAGLRFRLRRSVCDFAQPFAVPQVTDKHSDAEIQASGGGQTMRKIVVSGFAVLLVFAACGLHASSGFAMMPSDGAGSAVQLDQRAAQIEAVQRAVAGQTDAQAAKDDSQF